MFSNDTVICLCLRIKMFFILFAILKTTDRPHTYYPPETPKFNTIMSKKHKSIFAKLLVNSATTFLIPLQFKYNI